MVTNVITKCNGKDKVVDFRDKLSRSLPDEYAMMHQSGGKKNGGKTFPSVIEMVICDFTKGTGDKSVTCSVNIDPTMFDEWLTVCRCNVGTMAVPLIGRVAKDAQKPWETVLAPNAVNGLMKSIHRTASVAKAYGSLLSKSVSIVAKAVKGAEKKDILMAAGTVLKEARTAIADADVGTALKFPNRMDYQYAMSKVNTYKKGTDGFAPVSMLTVTHDSVRQDGDLAMYPWVLKITNGEAKVIEQATGATTFDGKSMRNKVEVFIQVSDRDMYRMMYRVTRFIETWENAMCIPVIIEGENKKEAERQEYPETAFSEIQGGTNKEKVFSFLTEELGLNNAAACGVMANIQNESGFNPARHEDKNTYGDGLGEGYGLCQWSYSRKTALLSFLQENGFAEDSIDGQLWFFKTEIESSERTAWNAIKNLPNTSDGAYEAGRLWCLKFERPRDGVGDSVERGNLAQNTYWPAYGGR